MPILSTTELALIIGLAVILIAGIAALVVRKKRRTERLRNQFGATEYARTVKTVGNQRIAEAKLEERTQRVVTRMA
jgi:LPXTG-motif cell wall-anchored protein